jgi:hypothetical protein
MPSDDRRGLNDRKDVHPTGPRTRNDDPEGPVDRAQARPPTYLQDGELLAQHEVLGDQVRSGAKCGEQGSDDRSIRTAGCHIPTG